jgi:hypothetical protein
LSQVLATSTTRFIFLIGASPLTANAQEKAPDKIAERFFMPAIQMGSINHTSENISSSGLKLQTSLDYRTKRGILFRINYDIFNGRLNLKYESNLTYSGRVPMSDLIGGIGYRLTKKRNNYFIVVQSSIRFYENPEIKIVNGNLNIEHIKAAIGTMRYTIGYEYEWFENVFLNSEIFTGHFCSDNDFWSNDKSYFGITIGVSVRLL